MTRNYPENVIKIAKILSDNGHRAYAVGGCMRDLIMGRTPNDWDMTTDCSPDDMIKIFDSAGVRTIPTGLKHGTVSILIDGEIYECTTFRIDGSYTDSRHPDAVTFTTDITEDLRRRDFTVNAMAGDPLSKSGETVDVFGGLEDIEKKIIRAVGDPEKRFTEDALRILRAIRFATVLDFEIEEETKQSAIRLGERLSSVSAERKSVELQKILLSPHADRGISLLLETDTAKYIHPNVSLPRVPLSTLPCRFETRLAALFKSVPSLSCMKLSNDTVKKVKLLSDDALFEEAVSKFERTDATARLMLAKYGEIAPDAALLRGQARLAEEISSESKKSPCLSLRELAIGGNDLIDAGIEAKRLGGIMSHLLLSVIEDPSLNQKDTLISIARDLAAH